MIDTLAAGELPTKFKDYLSDRNLHPEHVNNMGERGINFKILIQQTYTTNQEKSAADFKANKERITEVFVLMPLEHTGSLYLWMERQCASCFQSFENVLSSCVLSFTEITHGWTLIILKNGLCVWICA